jgi:hypothetical protein
MTKEDKYMTPSKKLHRLLFHALTEMREEGRVKGDPLVAKLADLFHNVVLQMELAAAGDEFCTYEKAWEFLQTRAKEIGCETWVRERLQAIEARSREGIAKT